MSENIFVKVLWNTQPVEANILYFTKGQEGQKLHKIVIGEEINISFLDQKLCIGVEERTSTWISCITNNKKDNTDVKKENKVDQKFKQCFRCRQHSFFNCRMTCMGDVCMPNPLSAKKYCEPPETNVYLTSIAEKMKIGVSLGSFRRFLEQGSDYAAIIAKTMGLEARRIETRSAKELGLVLQIRNSYKIKNLKPLTMDDAVSRINIKVDEISPIVKEVLSDIDGEHYYPVEILDLGTYYGDLNIKNTIEEIVPKAGKEFGGRIVAIKGSILVIEQSNNYFALDMKKMISQTFKFLNRQAKMRITSAIDDWF
jgi:hypothetical protein